MAAERTGIDPLCRLLDWDTQFFGFRIGRVIPPVLSVDDMAGVSDWCRRESIRCLYFSCDPGDDRSSRLAEGAGFHLVDVRLDFSKRIGHKGKTRTSTTGLAVRQWVEADLPALESISATAYSDTRFWHDPKFPGERVTALYRQWIVNSCRGFADRVFVTEYEGQPVGFVTCSLDAPGVGRIGLVGVRSDMRGKGAGRALVEAATDYAVERGWTRIEVATQARNLSAQRLYQRLGFTTCSTSLWYHWWL
jgi:dTDP-4-amino-4,6-dideoxy-D-galactose acyltransferase